MQSGTVTLLIRWRAEAIQWRCIARCFGDDIHMITPMQGHKAEAPRGGLVGKAAAGAATPATTNPAATTNPRIRELLSADSRRYHL